MGSDGVQYVRTLDGSAALSASPQLITLPIALPGAKPGEINIFKSNYFISNRMYLDVIETLIFRYFLWRDRK